MKTKRFVLYVILYFVMTINLLSISSCKKVPEHIGDSLQPNSSYINVAFIGDTNIIAKVEHVDSLNTKSINYSLLGDIYDPIFGNSNLSFYTQIGLTSTSADINWGENAAVDSIVLQLVYSGYYGDTLTPQTVRIFEVTEAMDDSTSYYSNTILNYSNEEYANYQFLPHPKTYSNIEDDSLNTAVLRIPVDNSLGEHFIHDENANFSSDEEFMKYFKGLYLVCEHASGTGAISYFNLLHTKSYLRIYYHNVDDTTFLCEFKVSNKYARFNHFEHSYNVAVSPICFDDTVYNRYLYVQSTAGVRTWLKFPNIAQWAKNLNGNILINEAKLIMTGAPDTVNTVLNDTSIFTPPEQLIAVAAKADGTYGLLPDQLVGTNYFGGYYDKKTNQVWFRLSEYIQDLVNKGPEAENYGIYLYTNAGSYNAKRWIFNGPDFPGPTAIKLEIIYSKIED